MWLKTSLSLHISRVIAKLQARRETVQLIGQFRILFNSAQIIPSHWAQVDRAQALRYNLAYKRISPVCEAAIIQALAKRPVVKTK
jgi:hypothetical protein